MIITSINRQVLKNCRINQINIRQHYYLNFYLHDTVVINVFQDGPCVLAMKLVWINVCHIQRKARATEQYDWKIPLVLQNMIIAKLKTRNFAAGNSEVATNIIQLRHNCGIGKLISLHLRHYLHRVTMSFLPKPPYWNETCQSLFFLRTFPWDLARPNLSPNLLWKTENWKLYLYSRVWSLLGS